MTNLRSATGLVPRLRRSHGRPGQADHLRDRSPALPGWAHVWRAGPPGLASMAIFSVSFLPQLATDRSVAPPARRGGRGRWDDRGRRLGRHCLLMERTAGPSASLPRHAGAGGMTKGRAALTSATVTEGRTEPLGGP